MTTKAGQRAKKTGEYVCSECEATVYVEKGQEIPTCPCGSEEFEERIEETTQSHRNKPKSEDW